MPSTLNTIESAVLEFLRRFLRDQGRAATMRDVMAGFGFQSTSTAHHWLQKLERHGHLKKSGDAATYGLVAQPGCCAACGQPVPEDPAATAAS